MPFPSTPILDTFDRADAADLGSDWQAGGWSSDFGNGHQILVNRAAGVHGWSWHSATWLPAQPGPDVEVYATITLPTSPAYKQFLLGARIAGRLAAAMCGYVAGWYYRENDSAQAYLARIDNGTRTELAAIDVSIASGAQLGLEIVGDVLTVYMAGVAVLTTTDSTYSTAGEIAFVSEADGWRVDNFGGGTISSGGSGELVTLDQASSSTSASDPLATLGAVSVAAGSAAAAAQALGLVVALGAVSVAPAAAAAQALATDPTVATGAAPALVVTPAAAAASSAATSSIVILGPVSVATSGALANGQALGPIVILGPVSVAPGAAGAAAQALDPAVEIGGAQVAPAPARARSAATAPSALFGALQLQLGEIRAHLRPIAPAVQIGQPIVLPGHQLALQADLRTVALQRDLRTVALPIETRAIAL